MYIQQVISYGGAWDTLRSRFSGDCADIVAVISAMTAEKIAATKPRMPYPTSGIPLMRWRLGGFWDGAMEARGWMNPEPLRRDGQRNISMTALGYARGNVSVALQVHREGLNRWLYTVAPIAVRKGIIELPVAVSLLGREEQILLSRTALAAGMFDRIKGELSALAPLSHPNPFAILGVGLEEETLKVVELPEEHDRTAARRVVVDRSIEFPPEYHQACLGILSYFGTVLREKYPEHDARVRIEQDGLRVRLVIESEDGSKEVIEKALEEYKLVVVGEESPENFFESRAKVLELKNELRIAQVRIETQKDLIQLQADDVASLRQMMRSVLSGVVPRTIAIEVNPVIGVHTNTDVQVLQQAPILADCVQELTQLAGADPDLELRLLDLEQAVGTLSTKSRAEDVRNSGGMKKLRGWLEEANQTGSAVSTFLCKAEAALEVTQKLARAYNFLAQWCGAPQVPSILVGRP